MFALFRVVLTLSVTASCVIPVVLLTRWLLRQVPKQYSYLLWSVVLYRLLCPVSWPAVISIFGLSARTPAGQDGGVWLGQAALSWGLPEASPLVTSPAGAGPTLHWFRLAAVFWCFGLVALLAHSLVAWMRVRRRAATAVRLTGNIYQSDNIRSPFIYGWLHPRILIPFGLAAEQQALVLRHEQVHLRRRDHLVRALGFALLLIHWFNPLVWLAFALLVRDMELSCDEAVLSETGAGTARQYSTALLSLATNRRFALAGPLAFGEASIRQRVANILKFRKPGKWASLLAAIACTVAIAICATDPLPTGQGYRLTGGILIEGTNSTQAAYQRFEGVYRREITLPQGRTRFWVHTTTMMRITVEDLQGRQLGTSPSRDSAAVMAKVGGSSTSIGDRIEVDVQTAGTYVLAVRGEDFTGTFQVGWTQPK